MEYMIPACSGMRIDVRKGQFVTIVDIEGGQVVDFFAQSIENGDEFLSPGVTIDCNESLRLDVGSIIYSNLYRAMFTVVEDDVGEHDLVHPCGRRQMYDFFYHNGEDHLNCFDNINGALDKNYLIINPINLFMHTKIHSDGKISVEVPKSKAGDRIVLEALMDVSLGLASCSVSESKCNSGKCSPVKIIID